jgi:hypothetical protein
MCPSTFVAQAMLLYNVTCPLILPDIFSKRDIYILELLFRNTIDLNSYHPRSY